MVSTQLSKLFFALSLLLIVAHSTVAQPSPNSTIIFEEDWETAVANTIPTGWSGKIDTGIALDVGWVVGMGMSSMDETGPNGANTGDKYMYFESGSPAGPGEMADLISPPVTISGSNPTLSFAAFMYGVDIEMLDVSVMHTGGTTLLQRYSTELQSAKSDPWAIQTFDLSAYDGESIQIVFAAQKMNLSEGDIAIDSVAIYSVSSAAAIPALGQWGSIILFFMLSILMVARIKAVRFAQA